jgi:hypothetical protein
MYGERRGGYSVLVEKPEGKRALGRSMRKWEYNIKKKPQEVAWGEGLDSPNDKWRSLVNAELNLRIS